MPDHISSGIMIDEGLVEAGKLHVIGVTDIKKIFTLLHFQLQLHSIEAVSWNGMSERGNVEQSISTRPTAYT